MWWIRIFVVDPNFSLLINNGMDPKFFISRKSCSGSGSTALRNQPHFEFKIQKGKQLRCVWGLYNFPYHHWFLLSPPLSLYGQGGGGGGATKCDTSTALFLCSIQWEWDGVEIWLNANFYQSNIQICLQWKWLWVVTYPAIKQVG